MLVLSLDLSAKDWYCVGSYQVFVVFFQLESRIKLGSKTFFRAIILSFFPFLFKEGIFFVRVKNVQHKKEYIFFLNFLFRFGLFMFFFIYFIKFVVLCGKSQILHLKEPFLRKRVLSFFRSFIQKAKVVLFFGVRFFVFSFCNKSLGFQICFHT